VTAVALTADPAVVRHDTPSARAQPTSFNALQSLSESTGVEQVVDIHGRVVEIPDDFVVMEAAGNKESKPSRTTSDAKPLHPRRGSQHLYQGEEVSLEAIESVPVAPPQVFQQAALTANTRVRERAITPDPLPVSARQVPHSASPLTGFRHIAVSTVNKTSALTEYRALTKADLDPFNTPVSWRFEIGATVGDAVRRLAAFIGYQVSVESPQVNTVYAMRLPYVHRQVRHLKVQTAFEIIGGAGMFVVVDHRKRQIAHYLKALGDAESALPGCFELGFVEWESPTTGYCRVRDKRCRL
ncbi:MAG: hypothetical protein AAF404_13105, partial [Pseudomonadota bacterium]